MLLAQRPAKEIRPTPTVTATIVANCAVSATDLDFGATSTVASGLNASSSIGVTCTNGAPYDVGLNAGNGSGATVTNRKMTSGGSTILYAMYRNSGRTANWGQTVGTDTVSATGTGLQQSLTVYGRIPTQYLPPPGMYTDTVVVTVTY